MPTTHLPTPPFQPRYPQQPTNNTTANHAPSKTGPPTHLLRRKSYKQHLQNEREAIKKHLDRFLATTTSSSSSAEFPSAEADKRWNLLVAQRAGKVRERVSRGKGSVEENFPEFWDAGREVAWLRRGWRGFLEGGGGGSDGKKGDGKGGWGMLGRGKDRDDDEEVVVGGLVGVKKEEGEGGDEVGSAGLGCGGEKGQQVMGREGSSREVKVEMGGEEVERASSRGQVGGTDEQGRVSGRKLGRGRGKGRLVNEAVVGVACSRGWAIQNGPTEVMEKLVDTAATRIADVVVGFAGSRGALFEPMATGEAETDDFEPGSKRKAEDGMVLPDKRMKLY